MVRQNLQSFCFPNIRERVFFNVLLLIPDQKKTTLVFSMFLTQYSIFYLSIFSKVEWLYRMEFFISKVRAHVNMQLLTPNDALR